MEKLRVRDVPLRKRSETARDISRERVEAYMRHLGVELEWIVRDATIATDGSRQCVLCLEHKEAQSFAKRHQSIDKGSVPACVTCREQYGWSGHNRGKSLDAKKAAQ